MTTLRTLSPTRHRHLRWKPNPNYAYASDRNLVALAAAELPKAALALPLTFIEEQGHWSLCALLGLFKGQNLYVGPGGRWLTTYVPALLRGHPFHLGWEGETATLCLDEASSLLVEDSSGEPIFDEGGDLSSPMKQVWSFLSATAENLLVLRRACTVLAEARLIAPWPISVQDSAGRRAVPGLHRIDEVALNALDDDAFARLRRTGVLPVAYAQLLSMGHLAELGKLAEARAVAQAQAEAAERARHQRAPLINLPEDSTIDWDWSKIGRP